MDIINTIFKSISEIPSSVLLFFIFLTLLDIRRLDLYDGH
jgi:hypothetical protein